ncbi:MAG: heterodisulfide reductase-related iron-sulfur binding cluster, partial [Candidatus Aminicenantes bacterium]|nr:heterodisulfide reductase-related iron-sulfur binding cluster [Candidatus Aminicenantes bacterium]
HLKHIQGVYQEPRQLLKMIADGRFVEMDEADLCCGFGGLYSFFHNQTASAINKRKVRAIKATGANLVVTGCPGCLIYLRQGIEREKLPIKAKHLIEVLKG